MSRVFLKAQIESHSQSESEPRQIFDWMDVLFFFCVKIRWAAGLFTSWKMIHQNTTNCLFGADKLWETETNSILLKQNPLFLCVIFMWRLWFQLKDVQGWFECTCECFWMVRLWVWMVRMYVPRDQWRICVLEKVPGLPYKKKKIHENTKVA